MERAEIVGQHTKVKAEKMSLFALDFPPETRNPSLSFARHQSLVRLGLIKLKIKAQGRPSTPPTDQIDH